MPKELTDEERDAAHEKINKKYNITGSNIDSLDKHFSQILET